LDKRIALAKQKMQTEMPNEMAASSIKPTGLLGSMTDKLVQRMIGGTPAATTNPLGGIRYNPDQIKGLSQNELEDVFAHELTHVGQYQKMPFLKRFITPDSDEGLPEATKKAYRMQGFDPAYRGKSTEMEAYQTEAQRKAKRGEGFPGYDIQLFPPKKPGINTGPSFKPKVKK
jgi:hypothetical protein